MGLLRYLHRRKRHEARGRHVNPFADNSHEGSSNSQDPSSRRSSSASNASGSSKNRPSVDDLSDLQRERVVEAFRIIDKDGDGKISKQELGMMWQRLGEHISEEELRYMIQDADGDGDGLIDIDEFVALQKILGTDDQEEHLQDVGLAFDLADTDHSGCISAVELQKVMEKLGRRKVTLEDCVAMCRAGDTDGDGMISFEEFQRLMASNAFQE